MQAFRFLDFFKRVMIGVFQCTSIGPYQNWFKSCAGSFIYSKFPRIEVSVCHLILYCKCLCTHRGCIVYCHQSQFYIISYQTQEAFIVVRICQKSTVDLQYWAFFVCFYRVVFQINMIFDIFINYLLMCQVWNLFWLNPTAMSLGSFYTSSCS